MTVDSMWCLLLLVLIGFGENHVVQSFTLISGLFFIGIPLVYTTIFVTVLVLEEQYATEKL